MNFIDAIKAYVFKWNDFRSRSSRAEYWWATLFVTLVGTPLGLIIGYVIALKFLTTEFSAITMEVVVGVVILPIQIFIIIAATCLVIRRLHDVDMSGWWYLLIFTIIGIIPILKLLCSKGTDGENRFGKDPLEQMK